MERTERNGLDRRHTPRWNLMVPLRLFDTITDEFVGNVVDISLEGMLVVANKHFNPLSFLQFTLELPCPNGKWTRVPVHVIGKHATHDSNSDLYRVGFQFADVTRELLSRLHQLINSDLAFGG
jgi:hypothetical protein